MDLPDCPPGAEGYQDSVTEVARKFEDTTCTKAEIEFQEHLNSLKIKLEDGSTRPMVQRGGRDVSGKWIYLCYPCAAVCSGESILQTHISGKKHKAKLALTNAWPLSIFEDHPYHNPSSKPAAAPTEKVLQKMAHEVDFHNKATSELEKEFGRYREIPCQLQDSLNAVKAPLIGLEYLIEHPPEQAHYEPKYICTLCSKQGHPRTIINHMTCFWHRYNYILRHFPKACHVLTPYRQQTKYREGVGIVISRLVQRIEDKYGRMRPLNIDIEEYQKDKERIHQWIFKGDHFTEKEGCTFEEVVDGDLIDSLYSGESGTNNEYSSNDRSSSRKEPSPPVVAAPSKPHFNHFSRPAGRQSRHTRTGSMDSLSDISDDLEAELRREAAKRDQRSRDRYDDRRRGNSPVRSRYTNTRNNTSTRKSQEKTRAPNYEYKIKLATDKQMAAEEFAKKTLAYHEKNPEKHPLYPEEWKKFWNKRYKEIQAEGKDPSKHDFKPEWIVFWTARMKELHDEELRITVNEIYRKMCLSPPDMTRKSPEPRRASDTTRRGSEDTGRPPAAANARRRPPQHKRGPSPHARQRSPEPRRRSPEPRRRSPEPRRRSPEPRRRSPIPRQRSPIARQRSPLRRRSPDVRRDRRSPIVRRSPARRVASERHRSPLPRRHISRSRSPIRRVSPGGGGRAPLESSRRSRSPLSQREMQARNRSPDRDPPPSMQTVLISDDELKPDDGLSPWNSDNEIGSVDSMGSLTDVRSRTGSIMSRGSKIKPRTRHRTEDHGAPDDVVATLRLLVALEDYLGSLGPKLVDLLAEALKMEKEKANSSEELLLRDSAVVLLETAKEKLKGAAQAGLMTGSAAAAARAAVVRAAATLHEADKRQRKKQQQESATASSTTNKSVVPVAGVGEVDRAQIAQQMAEALIAQGKTDVSSEELAQLVDAVVGMAEAKKREAERRQPDIRPVPKQTLPSVVAPKASGTATALQMLQSAYDENDKSMSRSRSRSVTPAPSEKGPTRESAARRALIMGLIDDNPRPDPELSPPPHCLRAFPVIATPGGSINVQGGTVPVEQTPGGRVRRIRSKPAVPLLIEKEDAADAMDGLSDSDLETLLKNFNELSAEEQHSLIAYLKKLEAREPARVERLRQYVSDAAHASAGSAPGSGPAAPPPPRQHHAPLPPPARDAHVVIESDDDDDYTVEEVFKSATQKVKEDQIRQEMEIVKKSLEEAKPIAATDPEKTKTPEVNTDITSIVDITRNISSASDLLALVQASLRSTPALTPAPIVQPPEVVTSNIQPRSFGDLPEIPMAIDNSDESVNPLVLPPLNNSSAPLLRNPPQFSDNRNTQSPLIDYNNQDDQDQNNDFNQDNQTPNDRFNQGNQRPNDRFNQGNQPPNDRFNQGNQPMNERFNQDNQPPNDRFNQGNQPPNFKQGNQPPNDRFNQGNQPPNDRFNQGNQPPNDRFNQSNQPPNDRFNQGNQPPHDRFNQGNQPSNDRFNQGNQQSNDRFNPGNQNDRFNQGNPSNDRFNQQSNERFNQGNQPNDRFNQNNKSFNDRFNQGNQPPNDRFNKGNPPPNDRFNQGNQMSNDRFNQGNQPNDRFNQGNQPNEQFNQGNQWNQRPMENRAPLIRGTAPLLTTPDNFAPGHYNQGPRSNFMNRGQDNYDNRQQNQQFGGYDNQNNFRGRGRGNYGGPMRGRGRGYY